MTVSAGATGELPHDLDIERAALGAVLFDPSRLPVLQDMLSAEDFYSAANRTIFHAMTALVDENVPLDLLMLVERLRKNGELDGVGGASYVATLSEYVYTTESVPEYARKIVEFSRLRKLAEAARKILDDALHSPQHVNEILDESEKRIFDLTQQTESREFVHVEKVAGETVDIINKHFHNRQAITGLPTGFVHLDEMLTGLQKTDLIILAARPSMGKTAFALNVTTNVVLKSGPVGFFSLEMSSGQLVQRILCSMARVPMQKVRHGMLGRADLEKLDEQARRLSQAPLYIDDTPGLNILEVRAKARRLKARVKDLGLIVLDYLQLMRGHGRQENRQQEVAEISRSLKALARELEVPVIALSQLSRGIEQRKGRDKEPKLSDLRESGAIEQDADVVMFVHRERQITEAGDQGNGHGQMLNIEPAEVIVGKQRNGPVGKVRLLFLADFTKFETLQPDAL